MNISLFRFTFDKDEIMIIGIIWVCNEREFLMRRNFLIGKIFINNFT